MLTYDDLYRFTTLLNQSNSKDSTTSVAPRQPPDETAGSAVDFIMESNHSIDDYLRGAENRTHGGGR